MGHRGQPSPRPPRVLVAEDEPSLLLLYRIWLEEVGYDVVVAGDGREALAEVEGERLPDAAVLDVEMPYVDGLDVCRRLRQRSADVPIVFVTALDQVSAAAAGAGADAVLAKPSDRKDVLEALEAARASHACPAA